MATSDQNRWAQLLEDASQKEIRQMAEWAAEHIESVEELKKLRDQIDGVIWTMTKSAMKLNNHATP